MRASSFMRVLEYCTAMIRSSVGVLLLALGVSLAACHPGNGIVVLEDGSVVTGDAVRNGIWLFKPGTAPQRLATEFHCHWLFRGADGKLYAETVAERGGTWYASHYQIFVDGRPPRKLGNDLAGDSSCFTVDRSGRRIVWRTGKFVRPDSRGIATFRDGGRLAQGESPMGTPSAYAWDSTEVLYFCDGPRIRSLSLAGEIRTVLALPGRATQPTYAGRTGERKIWGFAVSDDGSLVIADASTAQVLRYAGERPSVVSRGQDGWIATGVATRGRDVYVLETKLQGSQNLGPRVRRIDSQGKSALIGVVR